MRKSYEYQQRVLQTITTDPLGYQTVHTYDGANRLVDEKRKNPFGVQLAHRHIYYDLGGNRSRVIDAVLAEGKVLNRVETFFFYNESDQLTALVEAAFTPEQKITRHIYNHCGQKAETIKPDGIRLSYGYDASGHLKSLESSDQSVWYVYDYNRSGQVTSVVDHSHHLTMDRLYDQMGQMVQEKLGNGLTTSYHYDRVGRATVIVLPDQTGIEYSYNAVDLKGIHRLVDGKRTYSHLDCQHNLAGLPLLSQPPGQSSPVHYRYDALNRCLSIQSNVFKQHIPAHGYDAAGNLLSYQTDEQAYAFSYDDLYQLQTEKGHESHSYQCDSLSNRLLKDGQAHMHNALNQLLRRGNESFVYDLNGNLLQRLNGNETTFYTYDALDRLVKVSHQGAVTSYIYDAFNRRLTKKRANQMDQHYFYQGQEEIGAWEEGAVTELKLLSKGERHPAVAIELRQQVYIPTHDLFGNTACLSNLQGEVVERYRYTAFGEAQILSPEGNLLEQSAAGNCWLYANKRWDAETGFVAFGMRYYDPDLGRWVTADPAGFEDGPNLYAYVHHSPLIYCDEFGLFTNYLGGLLPSILSGYPFTSPMNGSVVHRNFESSELPCPATVEAHLESWDTNEMDVPSFYYGISSNFNLNEMIDPRTNEPFNLKENPMRGIGFTPGIMNNQSSSFESAVHISDLTGHNVRGTHCKSYNPIIDGLYYFDSLLNYAAYEGVRELHRKWNDFVRNSPPGSLFLENCHSRGAVYVRNALMCYPPELRQRICVLAVAPGCYIDPSLCHSVIPK